MLEELEPEMQKIILEITNGLTKISMLCEDYLAIEHAEILEEEKNYEKRC